MENFNTVFLHTYDPEDLNEELKAWVVYSTFPDREIAAAFYEKGDAVMLHQKLAESEEPVLLDVSEIDCLVDEYKEWIRSDAQLYTVVLENGRVNREDTYDNEVFNLRKPTFEPGRPEIFAGTVWGYSIDGAIRDVEKLFKEVSQL